MKSIVVALAALGLVGATSLAGTTMFSDAAFAKPKCKKGQKYDKKSKTCVATKKRSAPKGSK
ncbi:MAG: hypothetical protein ACREC6_03885, partial [Hyphomicrobiaceae bacterium]